MAIDTSILTSQPGPLQLLAQVGQIKAQQQQQQLVHEQVQNAQVERQQHTLQMQQQQAVVKAFQDSKGDVDAAVQSLYAQGNPNAPVIDKNRNEAKKLAAEAGKAQMDLEQTKLTHMVNLSDAVLNAPAELKPFKYQWAKQFAEQQGWAKPGQLPDTYTPQTEQLLSTQRDSLMSAKDRIDQATKQAEGAKFTAQANEANVNTGKTQAMLPGQIKNQGLETTKLTQETTGTAPLSVKDKQELALRKQEANTSAGRLNIEKQRFGFEQGGGVSPQAQAIAAGQIDPQTVRMMVRSNPGLISQVKSVDPGFDMVTIDKRYDTLREFTNTSVGKAGGQVTALNTLIHHADLYMQAADALKNGTFKPGNAVYNAVATAFGKAPPTNADLVARFFASETGKVATGGVPAEGEVNGILKNLGSSGSPEQMKQAGQQLLGIAAGRMEPLKERVADSKLDNVVQVLGPSAREALQRNGFNPDTMKPAAQQSAKGGGNIAVSAPNGKTYHFKDQAAADAFKKEAGIQ